MSFHNSDFVHLHLHTEFSLLDGACRIDGLMKRVRDLGQTAVAITDHGVMFGCVEFYKAAQKYGIKPIIGCEMYIASRGRKDKIHGLDSSYHLILLCKNKAGYQNLMKLVSAAHTEGFYNKPRIDHELLEQYHDGLVCLSACLAGEVPQALLSDDFERAKEIAQYYKSLFGDDYYIELQNHGIAEQAQILPDLIRLSRELDIPLAATNDCHYLEQEDSEMQQALICVQTKRTFDDDDKLEFKTNQFYVRTTEEMADLFSIVPDAVANTGIIAQKCNFDFEFGVIKLPQFVTPDGSDNKAFFHRQCFEGLDARYGIRINSLDEPVLDAQKLVAVDRLRYELSVIESMGYVDYFLIVWDFIRFAKSKGIPVGPGRGSGAGSLCAYCLGITGIDPIGNNLLFERFLNPERITMPDFDIDFCYERRGEVLEYVNQKYGAGHVAQIVTFGTMMARAAVRDIGRVLGIPYAQVDTVAKLIPQELGITIDRALSRSKELRELYDNDPNVRRLLELSTKIEGMPRHASTHAAGVVITQEEVSEYVPLQLNDEQIVTQYPMGTLEELGLLKMDFLGLRTLTVIRDSELNIQQKNPGFCADDVPLDDAETYKMLSAGNTVGVFQYESGGMKNVLMGLKPTQFEDLVAVVSLYRPGPMESIPAYIENSKHPEQVRYKTPMLKPILDVTYGVIVYQEQVMQIFRDLAGFSLGQADLVRRAMSKKKHDVMEEEGKIFIYGSDKPGKECDGCLRRGISENTAKEIYAEMAGFASYAFNKSHAAPYALLAYQTAYLKCHYPVEYLAALLTSVLESTDSVMEYISECRALGIEVLPPDINISSHGFTVDGEKIRFGLLAIKSVGQNLITSIIRERESRGPFTSFLDFCKRTHATELNKRALEALIKCGCFDSFRASRRSMVLGMDSVIKAINDEERLNISGQLDLFQTESTSSQKKEAVLPDVPEFEVSEMLNMEKELTGLYLTGHPLLKYSDFQHKHLRYPIREFLVEDNADFDNREVDLLVTISSVRVKVTRSNTTIAFVNIEDLTGVLEMMVFSTVLERYAKLLKENHIVVVRGRLSVKEDEEIKLICKEIFAVEEYAAVPQRREFAGNGTRIETAPAAMSASKLYLKFDSVSDAKIDRAKALLSIFNGKTPVHFFYADTRENVRIPSTYWADTSSRLKQELESLLGSDSVIYK